VRPFEEDDATMENFEHAFKPNEYARNEIYISVCIMDANKIQRNLANKDPSDDEDEDVIILERDDILQHEAVNDSTACDSEPEDGEGFQILHRFRDEQGEGGITYKPPYVRSEGCSKISADISKNSNGTRQYNRGWKGWFLSNATSAAYVVSLFRDTFSRNWTKLTHLMKLAPHRANLRFEREWFRREPLEVADLEIEGLHKEYLLRALGFRYPHRAMFIEHINVRHIANLKSIVHAFLMHNIAYANYFCV